MKQENVSKTLLGSVDTDVLAFTAGQDIDLDKVLIEPDCIGTAGHVFMLSKIKVRPPVISAVERRRIIAELVRIISAARRGDFKIRLEDQDVHMAVERVLTQRLGVLGKKVHTARSRNDQVAVDLRLYAKEQLLHAMDEVAGLAAALLALAKAHVKVPMVGRTHMQPAMPSTVGLWASAHAESLLDDGAILMQAYNFNNRCPLGSAAGYGVTLPIDRKLTARVLGFSRPIHNVLYASSTRGKCEGIILFSLSQVMLTLSRLAQDLMLYTMPEFGYFSIPAEYCTGSSLMPQKKNPDVLELIRAKTAKVIGAVACVEEMMRALPSGYNRDAQESKGLFMEGIRETQGSLWIMTPVIKGLKVNRAALAAGFSEDIFAADEVMDLVARGVPFREAYRRVKGKLDKLSSCGIGDAVLRKKHLGAPGGLDLRSLQAGAKALAGFAAAERRQYRAAVSRLLGVSLWK